MDDILGKNGKIGTADAVTAGNIAVKDGRIAGEGTPESLLTPEFIREIYDVEAEVVKDKKGQIHILFVE